MYRPNLTKRELEDIERLKNAKRIHQTHFTVPEMPWKKKKVVSRSSNGETIHIVDDGKCYYCQQPATYGFRGKLYCSECWIDLDEDPYEEDYS